ncbi:hypothetical protein [Miniphocaeibacter halophilus]|uniref:Uncharacterized protein n=1 Tax=Miniphocaeibacter halophilus TaxID=2931922 RepID=A0AC61MU55_9FIRM|nr:hypothetical protein [Miniphocaeibacter halophilus]QQK08354.1 hypothetical protein JFY71_02080 [Miniphocaeibacter halophilus]
MKNIKEQSELKTMKKQSIPPLITNICLLILILSQKIIGTFHIAVNIILLVSIISNSFPIIFFRIRTRKLNGEPININTTILKIVVIIILSVVIILYMPIFFQK